MKKHKELDIYWRTGTRLENSRKAGKLEIGWSIAEVGRRTRDRLEHWRKGGEPEIAWNIGGRTENQKQIGTLEVGRRTRDRLKHWR